MDSDKIKQLQNEFYSKTPKNFIFKKQQKLDCAVSVCEKYDINTLLNNCAYIVPNTNSIFFDYTVLKLFANPSNYDHIIKHINNLINYCIQYFENYNVHLNLATFTISAYERYKEMIISFCQLCFQTKSNFSDRLTSLHIYNIPHMFDNIMALASPFVDKCVQSKIITYNKKVTEDTLKLYNNSFIEFITKLK
jgi:hypothetical protein